MGSGLVAVLVPLLVGTAAVMAIASLGVRNEKFYAWYGLAFGIALFPFAFMSAGFGHGTYLPFALFAAPLSLVPVVGLFAAPVLWAGIGWLFRWRGASPVIAALSVHSVAAVLLLMFGTPMEAGADQLKYFLVAQRHAPGWLWTGIGLYGVGLVTAWAFAIERARADPHRVYRG